MRIVRAILAGERIPRCLAAMRVMFAVIRASKQSRRLWWAIISLSICLPLRRRSPSMRLPGADRPVLIARSSRRSFGSEPRRRRRASPCQRRRRTQQNNALAFDVAPPPSTRRMRPDAFLWTSRRLATGVRMRNRPQSLAHGQALHVLAVSWRRAARSAVAKCFRPGPRGQQTG